VPPKGLLEVLQTGQGQIEKYQVRKRWYISYREPIYDGKQLVGAVGVFDDISKMETLTSDLATYQQLLHENELLLNTSSLGIAVMDTDGNIVRQNEQFQQFYFLIMYDDYERTQFRNAFQTIQQHKQQEKILYIQTKQQQRLKCRLTSIPSTYNNNTERIIVQLEDITDEYEQQKQMMRFKQHIRHFFSLRHFDAIPISKAFEERLQHIAKVNAPVLLIGNIGTGRSITAKQIIKYSDRQMMPFIEIDCIGLTKKQLEQLLFSIYDPPPLLTLAAGGTLFIKNIDYLPISLQQRFVPVIKRMNELNIRLITSISQTEDPPPQIDEQLYYLINAITLTHPPLTKRTDHSKEVIQQLLENLCEKHNRTITLPEESIQFLIQHDWPENFHSIANLLEYFCLHVKADIWQPILFQQLEVNIANKPIIVNSIFPLKDAVKTVEKEMLKLLIEKNISYRQMAKILDVNPSTVVRKVKNLEVESIDS
jgi:transcriptional regulator with PAS, ATPase and Fis domain